MLQLARPGHAPGGGAAARSAPLPCARFTPAGLRWNPGEPIASFFQALQVRRALPRTASAGCWRVGRGPRWELAQCIPAHFIQARVRASVKGLLGFMDVRRGKRGSPMPE